MDEQDTLSFQPHNVQWKHKNLDKILVKKAKPTKTPTGPDSCKGISLKEML